MYFGKRRSSSGSENSFDYDGYKYSGEHDDADKKPDEAKHAHRKVHVIIGTAAIALAALSTSVYKVSEQQQAVLTRFGKVADVRSAGLYFRLPFGIDCVHMVPTITVGVPIGYTIDPETREEGTAGVASSTDDSTMLSLIHI